MLILNDVWNPPTLVVSGNGHGEKRRTKQLHPEGLSDAQIQAIAQSFAPKGVKARITNGSSNHG
jgi:hypothetical protein